MDYVFIMLPIGILGVKCILWIAAHLGNRGLAKISTSAKYLVEFFQPLLKGHARLVSISAFEHMLLLTFYDNFVERINPHTADDFLSRIDASILGNQVAFLLEPWIRPWLTDFLNAIYFSHLLFFPGVALYFYLANESKAFRRMMMGYLTLFLMGITSYILVPAVGPEKFFADQFTSDLHGQALSRSVAYIISAGRCFSRLFPVPAYWYSAAAFVLFTRLPQKAVRACAPFTLR